MSWLIQYCQTPGCIVAICVPSIWDVPMLSPEGRLPVRLAGTLYRAILDKLEAREWDVFAGRARTTLPEKLALTVGAWRENRD